jgi:FlaA1/EpsC-like NDP-sugar epimerase
MKTIFKNKEILITGGTGSVGREIIKTLLPQNPQVVRIFDVNETAQFEMREELKEHKNIRYLIGDVRDKQRLRRAVDGIDIIFHTAGLKHVVGCEYNPFEAVKTNVIGTQNLIDVALAEEVEKVIFTSSDKAVNPSNTMGTTKLLAEKLMISANYYRGSRRTAFSCVRFGNILGSSGSVVPVFREQIKRGGPVTLTDPKMTRFVISLDGALKLILKSVELSQGGEVFIMKMPILKIVDLAKVMIGEIGPKFGLDTTKIEIKGIGMKPGEKLYEELLTEDEALRAVETDDLIVVTPELKEMFLGEVLEIPNAVPVEYSNYKPDTIKPISKNEIKNLLIKEKLL